MIEHANSMDDLPPWASDKLVQTAEVRLPLWERLSCAFMLVIGGMIRVRSSTFTEHEMGMVSGSTNVQFDVPRVWPWRRSRHTTERLDGEAP